MTQLKKSLPDVKDVIERMIQMMESKRRDGPIDFQELCVKFTLDAIGVIALEKNLGGLDGSRYFYDGLNDTAEIGQSLMRNPFLGVYVKWFPSSKAAKDIARRKEKLRREWDQLTKEILNRPDPPQNETPIWFSLKNTVDPNTNAHLSYETLRSEIATVVHAGMDTTGHQLSWIFGMLASNPNVAEKLVDELTERGLCGVDRRKVAFEDLSELPYLNAVIKEGFRVAYIMPHTIHRVIKKDMTILGYRIPKGNFIVFPGNRMMNLKEEWGDPEVFRPERWLTGEDLSMKYCNTFLNGPRDCPGQKLAMIEMRLAIVMLLSKYRLTSEKSYQELLDNAMDRGIIASSGGLWINVFPRSCEPGALA